jgi:DNA modification methylase
MEIKSILGEKVLIEWRKMESLQPDNLKMPYNIGHLKKSLLENNFAMPFFGWQNGESVFVIDGHQRREVLSELESEGVKVPELLDCQLINAKDRQEAVKLLLSVFNSKSNPIDLEVLTEWVELEQVEVEITSLNVVDVNEVEDEIQEILEAEEDDFDSKLPETPETVLGDLYEIGEHRLLCGDSTDSDQVAKLMNGSKADMVFTDPPYGIKVVQGKKVGGDKPFGNVGGNNIVKAKEYSEIIGDDTTDTAKEFYQTCISLGMENFIIWGGNYFTDFLNPSMCWIIWDKENTGNFADVEMAWTSFNKGAKLYRWQWNGMIRKGDKSIEGKTRVHPTQKPVGLFGDIFNDFQFNICFDGFLGSGSTMVASHQLKRKCYGMELDPKYCDVIVKRMIKLDSNLKVKRNGIDETKKWLDKIK